MTILDLSHLFRGPYYTPARPGLPCHFKSEIVLNVTNLHREAHALFDGYWGDITAQLENEVKADYSSPTLWAVVSVVADWLVLKSHWVRAGSHKRVVAKVTKLLNEEKHCGSVEEVAAVIKTLYCPIMDIAEARLRLRAIQKVWTKAAIRQENKAQGFHFFDAKTMKANGDTMRNFSVCYSLTKGIYLKRLSNGQCWLFDTETGRLTLDRGNA